MKRIDLDNGHYIHIYASIKDLPIRRFKDFQLWVIRESGIGSDIQAVGDHFSSLHEFLAAGKVDLAMKEAENLHYNFFSIFEGTDSLSISFAMLIHSVDGEPVTDYSEESLNRLLDDLSQWGLTVNLVAESVSELKKKYLTN